jgi:hypothetical protein
MGRPVITADTGGSKYLLNKPENRRGSNSTKCRGDRFEQQTAEAAFFRSSSIQLADTPPLTSSLQSFETCIFLIALSRYPLIHNLLVTVERETSETPKGKRGGNNLAARVDPGSDRQADRDLAIRNVHIRGRALEPASIDVRPNLLSFF